MWVNNNDQPPRRIINFSFHHRHISLWEISRVKRKPLIIISLLDIHPQIVHWKPSLREIETPLSDLIGPDRLPLTEVESQSLNRWQHQVPRHIRKLLMHQLRVHSTSHKEKFYGSAFRHKPSVPGVIGIFPEVDPRISWIHPGHCVRARRTVRKHVGNWPVEFGNVISVVGV